MEFNEVELKPTYKILWGIPGRSNAINIAERLGLPKVVVDRAREQLGSDSAEINEIITDMERFKQEFQKLVHEAKRHLRLSKALYEKLLLAERKILDHRTDQRRRKMKEISEFAVMARSLLHKKAQQLRLPVSAAVHPCQASGADINQHHMAIDNPSNKVKNEEHPTSGKALLPEEVSKQSPAEKRTELPKAGDVVVVSSLGKKATVLRVDLAKEELLVLAGNFKLKVKTSDIQT